MAVEKSIKNRLRAEKAVFRKSLVDSLDINWGLWSGRIVVIFSYDRQKQHS